MFLDVLSQLEADFQPCHFDTYCYVRRTIEIIGVVVGRAWNYACNGTNIWFLECKGQRLVEVEEFSDGCFRGNYCGIYFVIIQDSHDY